MSNPNSLLASLDCPSSTAVEEPTHHKTSPETSPCRVTALTRDTVCSSTINSHPSNTVTTRVLSGGISSILPPSATTSSTHYHTVVCNSATCLGDRVITTPGSMLQDATPNVISLSPPHPTASSPQQPNQAPREHTQPPSANLLSREELDSAMASIFHNMQDMLTNFYTQIKEERAMPLNAQHTNHTPRRNETNRPPCQCGSSSPRERSPTPPSSPRNFITTRLHQEKMLQNLLKASEVKFDGKDSQDYAPWKRALQKEIESLNLTPNQELSLLEARTEDEANMVIKELRPLRNELGPDIALRRI